jgi:hypothetical protein
MRNERPAAMRLHGRGPFDWAVRHDNIRSDVKAPVEEAEKNPAKRQGKRA